MEANCQKCWQINNSQITNNQLFTCRHLSEIVDFWHLFADTRSKETLIVNYLQVLGYKIVTKTEYKHYFIDNQHVNNFIFWVF